MSLQSEIPIHKELIRKQQRTLSVLQKELADERINLAKLVERQANLKANSLNNGTLDSIQPEVTQHQEVINRHEQKVAQCESRIAKEEIELAHLLKKSAEAEAAYAQELSRHEA